VTKELAVASRQGSVSHFLFHQRIFDKNNPPYFPLFSRLKPKLKGRHSGTIEVMEADSQAVLNTLTEHDFLNAFKKWQKRWERCIRAEVTTSKVMVASRFKVNFSPDGSTSPGY
jgi:hypothetical protein